MSECPPDSLTSLILSRCLSNSVSFSVSVCFVNLRERKQPAPNFWGVTVLVKQSRLRQTPNLLGWRLGTSVVDFRLCTAIDDRDEGESK
jgi:hypothetical protein